MPLYQIRIEPLEPLLFGDNRSARAGFDHLQRDQDPSPLTLHGAIGRYLASRSETWPDDLLGKEQEDILNPRAKVAELLGYGVHGPGGRLLFPRPLHLRCTLSRRSGKAVPVPEDLLSPQRPDGVKSSAAWERLLVPEEEGERLVGEAEGEVLLAESALEAVLRGEVPQGGALLPAGAVRPEPRPGIAVDNDSGTVFDGRLFTRPYRRFHPPALEANARLAPAGFTAWFETLASVGLDVSDGIGFLGGDRRRVCLALDRCENPLGELCEQVAEAAGETESAGFLLYLLTPALAPLSPSPVMERGPGGEASKGTPIQGPFVELDQVPIAAALGRPVYVSGWDVKKHQPRPLRALVPAGSVYFYEWEAPPGPARAELVRSLWLQPFHQEGAAAGFGRCLVGIWR